jgi:hypothetical protein
MRRRSVASALLVAWLGVTASAWAQPSDDDRATARRLAIEGNAALEQKDYASAADKFGRADALFHAPTLLLGFARAQAGLGKLVSAHESYQRIVREGAPDGSKIFVDAVDDAKKELAALEPRVPWVTIQVTGAPEPAVTLDGAPLSAASLGVKRAIDPGSHALRATANGFIPAERTFAMREGQTEIIALALQADSAAPAPGGAAHSTPAQADTAPTADDASTLRTLGVVAMVVGGVGLVGGAVTGGLAISEHSLLDRDCDGRECPPERQSTLDNFRTLATISTVGFIAGGVCVAGGVTLLVLASRAEPAKTGFVPYVGPGNIGVRGRF